MNTNDDCRTYVEHLRNEHVHIDRALLELQHLFSQTVESRESDPTAILLAKLTTLRDALRKHFREEEEGGCLEEARSRVPCLSEDVHALQAEHAERRLAWPRQLQTGSLRYKACDMAVGADLRAVTFGLENARQRNAPGQRQRLRRLK